MKEWISLEQTGDLLAILIMVMLMMQTVTKTLSFTCDLNENLSA